MSEPVTASAVSVSALAAAASGAGITFLGVGTGLSYSVLLAGLFGGSLALSYLEPAKPLARAISVVSAAVVAGYSAPIVASILTHIPWVSDAPRDILQTSLGFAIGYLAHGIFLPGLRKVTSAWIGRNSQ